MQVRGLVVGLGSLQGSFIKSTKCLSKIEAQQGCVFVLVLAVN